MNYTEIQSIAEQLESPSFYVLNLKKFCDTYKKLEKSFCSQYEKYRIAYSFKTNYCPAVVSAVNRMGGYAEVVSAFEREIAIRAGFPEEKIIFNGPVKDHAASIALLSHGGTVIIDNEEELDALIAAQPQGADWHVGIRCNLQMSPEKISRFGFDVYSPRFSEILEKVQDHFSVRILHCHMGGFRELPYWEKRADEMIAIADRLRKLPEVIDLGSGMFGEMEESFKMQFHKEVPDFDAYTRGICKKFRDHFGNLPSNQQPWLMTEPGTTVIANAVRFYCPVTSVKDIRGKQFIEVYGSIHNLGSELAPKKNLPCSLIPSERNEARKYVENGDVVGYTCLEYDSLQRGVSGWICPGDYFEFRNVGSYSNVLKPPFIMPNFPMITYENGKIRLVKRKETNSDLYGSYLFD